jgi:hypothetical protein
MRCGRWWSAAIKATGAMQAAGRDCAGATGDEEG